MRDEIRDYLLQHGAATDVAGLSDDESLLEAGVIDSVAMVDLIAHLEGSYGIVVDEDDMVPENFDTIVAITEYVERKQTDGAHV